MLIEGRRIVESGLDLLMAHVDARRGAAFGCSARGLTLLLSHNLDQKALNIVRGLWADPPRALRSGSPYLAVSAARAYLVLPCLAPRVVGWLYLETEAGMSRIPGGHLGAVSGMVGQALASSSPGLAVAVEPGTVSDAERANLVLLLENNEWNISRVARLLGVTRMTVYNRMRRLGVAREHVLKKGAGRAGRGTIAPG